MPDFMGEGAEKGTMHESARGCRLSVDLEIILPREDRNCEVQEINLFPSDLESKLN